MAVRLRRVRRTIGAAVLVLVLAAIAAVGVSTLHVGAAFQALSGADPEMLAAGVALYFVAQTISGAMWGVCQESGGVRGISLPTTLGLHWISRASCELLPASLGEAVRVAVVRRHPAGHQAGGWRITGGIAGYKVIDAFLTAASVMAIAIATPLPGPAGNLRWTALGACVGLVVAGVLWRLGLGRGLVRLLPGRLRGVAGRVGQGAGVLRDPGAARTAAILGALAVVARILSMAALLMALHAPPQAAALAYAAICLAGVIPAAPGGAGTREVVLIPALTMAYGMSSSSALAFSMAIQATALITSLGVGALSLAWFGPRLIFRRTPAVAPAPELGPGAIPAPAAATVS